MFQLGVSHIWEKGRRANKACLPFTFSTLCYMILSVAATNKKDHEAWCGGSGQDHETQCGGDGGNIKSSKHSDYRGFKSW
jgi:hypothetical protein